MGRRYGEEMRKKIASGRAILLYYPDGLEELSLMSFHRSSTHTSVLLFSTQPHALQERKGQVDGKVAITHPRYQILLNTFER